MTKEIKLSINKDKEDKNSEIKSLKSQYNEFNKVYGFRKINPTYIYISAGIISLLWIIFIWSYSANQTYTFAKIFQMLPHEFGGFLSGIIMPICFIWISALYIDKNINSDYEHKVIYPFLQSIIDPYGDTSVITKVIKQKIQTETNELKKTIETFSDFATKLAQIHTEVSDNIKNNTASMQQHETTLNNITTNLNKSITDITKLNDTTSLLEKKTNSITTDLLSQATKLEETITELNSNTLNIENATNTALTQAQNTSNIFKDIGEKIITTTEIANNRSNQILYKID